MAVRRGLWTIPWKGTDVPYRNPEASRCTALRGDGQFCDAPSLPDAPFPVCLKHAAKLLRYLNSYAPNGLEDRIIVAVRGYEMGQEVQAEQNRRKSPSVGFIYYIQVGKLIKIGHTESLRSRLSAYPPDARLLATEPGTVSTEAQRHREFAADLRHRREWFAPSSALLAHIAALKSKAA
jgi:hypothetical protein